MDRASKRIVVACTGLALALQIWLQSGSWPGFWLLAPFLIACAAAAAMYDRRAVAVVLAAAYVFPVLISILHGRYHIYYSVLWSGALFGALLPTAVGTSWQVPRRWRGPLAAWALIVVAATAITIARESDFYLGLWFHERVSAPLFAASWIVHVALTLLIGILWFDWLCGARGLDLVHWVAAPLAASCAVLAAVAIYQSFVDIGFYNETVYGVLGRASGTVFDGNVCAIIAAFWVGGAALIGDRAGRFRWPVTIGGMAIAWMAVWATASRTGFGAALVTSGFVAVSAWRSRGVQVRLTWRTAAMGAAAALLLVVALAALRPNPAGPLQRLSYLLPDFSLASFAALGSELWNRNRYGEVATLLIQQFPWFGIGLGSFPTLGPELAMRQWSLTLEPDNAQNWFRQQFVELGLVGSLPWIVWVVTFAWAVLRRSRNETPARSAVRGALVAFAFISLLGTPGQDVSVAMTFWTFAGLYVALGSPEPATVQASRRLATPALGVPVTVLLLVLFIAGSLETGLTSLRPPIRARDNRQAYSYGFNAAEVDGSGDLQHWARRRAVIVIAPTKPVLRLSMSVNHLDLKESPVHAKVWVDRMLVFDGELASSQPVVRTVPVPVNGDRVMLRSEVNRVVRASDFGGSDSRELGLLLRWSYLDAAP